MTAFLKAEKLLVVLASDPNLFQSFAPLNEKLFCPKDVFNSGEGSNLVWNCVIP